MTHANPTPAARTALIVGATGSFGAHAAQALIKHGWTIRALTRDPRKAAKTAGPRTPIDWVAGDALNPAEVTAAADGVQLIVHAANPPRYRNWRGTVAPMLESAIAAARASGARLVLPGSVYNYAPNFGPEIAEGAPQLPVTRKGAIRVAAEDRLRQVADEGVKVLILRAGDFFGPAAPNSALSWLVTHSGGRMTGVYQPGPDAVGHAFAYLPDMAETLARLVDAEDRLGVFEQFHFRGHWLARNDELGKAIRRVAGQPRLPVKAFPWAMVWAMGPFNETFRELWEMRYLWNRPIGLSNRKLLAFLGSEPHTPLDAALAAALSDMGLLEGSKVERAMSLAPVHA
jgi:nucleoside-diphosphate-sugar epimerase